MGNFWSLFNGIFDDIIDVPIDKIHIKTPNEIYKPSAELTTIDYGKSNNLADTSPDQTLNLNKMDSIADSTAANIDADLNKSSINLNNDSDDENAELYTDNESNKLVENNKSTESIIKDINAASSNNGLDSTAAESTESIVKGIVQNAQDTVNSIKSQPLEGGNTESIINRIVENTKAAINKQRDSDSNKRYCGGGDKNYCGGNKNYCGGDSGNVKNYCGGINSYGFEKVTVPNLDRI